MLRKLNEVDLDRVCEFETYVRRTLNQKYTKIQNMSIVDIDSESQRVILRKFFDHFREKARSVVEHELSMFKKKTKVLQCIIDNHGIDTVCEEWLKDSLNHIIQAKRDQISGDNVVMKNSIFTTP